MTEPKTITFEKGYRRLQEIAEEVNETEVPVDRMGDLFAEGKGLDKALTDHLAEQKGRIERIEKGDEIQAFRIAPEGSEATPEESDVDLTKSSSSSSGGSDDDIPF
jgi:exodeoxyribonuclease VII small subunit